MASNSVLFSVTLAILVVFLTDEVGPHRRSVAILPITVDGLHGKLTARLRLLTHLQSGAEAVRPLLVLLAAPIQSGPPGSTGTPTTSPNSGRPIRKRRDPLRHHRAVVGLDARVRWWERVRAAVILLVMVVALGALLAIFVAFLIFLGTVLLEVLAG